MSLLNFVNEQILFLRIESAIFWVEKSELTHNCLMTRDNVELCLVFDRALVESDHVHVDNKFMNPPQWSWYACQASLYFVAFYLCH